MGKPNTYVQLQTALREIRALRHQLWLAKGFAVQQSLDLAQIALNREFQFGPKQNERFERAFRETFVDYTDLCLEDGEGDKEIIYTKEVVDRELRRVRGPDVLPFDERYAEERLYFRDSRKEWRDACQKDEPPA